MAKFVSNAKEFSVFLEMTEAGGKWATFVNGEYQTDNPVYAEKLRKFPTFGQDFYEVGHKEEKPEEKLEIVIEPGDLFKCPDCGKTESKVGKPFDTPVKVIAHARMEHKVNYKVKDIPQVK